MLKVIQHLLQPEILVLLSVWNVFPQASWVSSFSVFRPLSYHLLPRDMVSVCPPSSTSPVQSHHPTCYYRPITYHYLKLTPVIVYLRVYCLSSHSPPTHTHTTVSPWSCEQHIFCLVHCCGPSDRRVVAYNRHVTHPGKVREWVHGHRGRCSYPCCG